MTRYVGSLLLLFTAESAALLAAVIGGHVVIAAYATALSPRASATRTSRNRILRRTGSWAGVVLGTLVMISTYGVAGTLLGGMLLVSTDPEDVPATQFMAFSGAVVGAIQAGKCREGYLDYRRQSDFRLWVAHAGSRPPAAAHGYYFTGWRRHEVVRALSFSILIVTSIVVVKALNQAVQDFDLVQLAVGLAVVVTLLGVQRLAIGVWTVVRPGHELIRLCTMPTPGRTEAVTTGPGGYTLTRPGRWRSTEHRVSFRVAYLLEWCLRNTTGRFARDQREVLVAASCSIAESLRTHAINADQSTEQRDAFRRRLFFALQLATARDPLRFVDPVLELTFGEPDPPPLPRRRATRLLENASGVVNQHWPSLKAVFVVGALVALLIFGKFTDVLGLLK